MKTLELIATRCKEIDEKISTLQNQIREINHELKLHQDNTYQLINLKMHDVEQLKLERRNLLYQRVYLENDVDEVILDFPNECPNESSISSIIKDSFSTFLDRCDFKLEGYKCDKKYRVILPKTTRVITYQWFVGTFDKIISVIKNLHPMAVDQKYDNFFKFVNFHEIPDYLLSTIDRHLSTFHSQLSNSEKKINALDLPSWRGAY